MEECDYIALKLSRERRSVGKWITFLMRMSAKKRVPIGRASTEKRNKTMDVWGALGGAMAMLRLITTRGARSGLPVIIIVELAEAVTEVDLQTVLYCQGIWTTSEGTHTWHQIAIIRSVVNIIRGRNDALLRLRHPPLARSPIPDILS